MFPFLSLPHEIRYMVYRLALGVGVVHPYRQPDSLDTTHFTKTPNTTLLKTCRLVNIEASPFLYSHNTFFLPTTELTIKFFTKALHNPSRQSWVKSVHLTLSHHDLPDFEHLSKNPETIEAFDGSVFRQIRWEDYEHASDKRYLRQVSWPRKVRPILDLLKLDNLILDFSEARCPNWSGCSCWMTAGAIFAFHTGFAHGVPADLEVYGLTPCDAGGFYQGVNSLRLAFLETAFRMWTRQRNEKFVPLSQSMDAMRGVVGWREYEEGFESVVV